MKILKNKKIVFVDYFDTLVFRCVSPYDVQIRWAEVLKSKFEELEQYSAQEILDKRNEIKYSLRNDYEEVPYSVLLNKLKEFYNIKESSNEFILYSQRIEENIEMAVQTLNQEMIHCLKQYKSAGKKIYLLSDYYLPKDSVILFLRKLNIYDLFNDIFISETVNKTKRRNGSKLYFYALEKVGCEAKDVVMMGDNVESDYNMSKNAKIDSILYKRKNKQIIDRGFGFNKKFLKFKLKQWKGTPLLSYTYLLYLFTKYLYRNAGEDSVRKLTFLSRDGYFLKILFDEYQKLLINDKCKIESLYCYNSRLINQKLVDYGECNYIKYLRGFLDGGYINFVDCGWNNSAQEIITKKLIINSRGYYIGTFSKNRLDYIAKRKGLLYDINENGETSHYYWLLRTNFTLLEQLVGAPDGSLIDFESLDKKECVWPEQEKEMFNKHIKNLQKLLLQEFEGLAVWLSDAVEADEIRLLAKINVKHGLLSNEKELDLIRELSNNYYDNLSQNKNLKGNDSIRKRKPGFKDRLFYPEKRLSVLVKKQRHIKSKLNMFIYRIWARLFLLRLYLLGKFK